VTVWCATTNAGKLKEFRLAGERAGFRVDTLAGLEEISAPEEAGDTFEANAIAKALHYAAYTPDWLFTDDSGLEIDALAGAPGVQSARFTGPDANDETNNEFLLERLRGAPDRSAQFVCVIALAHAGKLVRTFRGVVRGEITGSPRGANGFGYDPLFYYPPFGCTFGEASTSAKMGVSHRARALEDTFRFLKNLDQTR